MEYLDALRLARHLVSVGISLNDTINNPAIPIEFRTQILQVLKEEETIVLQPSNMIVDEEEHADWLNRQDRSSWYYWQELRNYLLTKKGWSNPAIQSLDKETDKILGRLAPPAQQNPFDKRGLVLGYVQSGKTSNYTALIAKAVDSGYRLVIVLTGTDNGLRLQTQRRLKKELVGSADGVPRPPTGKQWVELTRDDIDGDFQPGYVNDVLLQGSQPVLLVIKKNGHVLRRLLKWLENEETMKTIPLLVIDDEADLASVDTRGSYQTEDEEISEDYEEPSVINRLIRDLLNRFDHKNYVAYTATPFANVLIPANNYDPKVSDDLYPRNFIVDLPKPDGYFGAEELFGRVGDVPEEETGGINVLKRIADEEVSEYLENDKIPPSMEKAIISFILGGAARAQRNKKDLPATMLIHISQKIIEQNELQKAVDRRFTELKDEWRYARRERIYDALLQLWEDDFKQLIERNHPDKIVSFEELESYISTFFESVQVKTINSASGQVLDYEAEPNLKAIAIGGNKLSRGLTLEGLLVSFFARRSIQYDTLMQMGRWFGFREGYEDLTRIYTTSELIQWFGDLADVERRLRADIKVYEQQRLTPLQVGMRIKAHPTMQVTSLLKRRFASEVTVSTDYSGEIEQTVGFPLNDLDELALLSENNLLTIKEFVSNLGEYSRNDKGPIEWMNVHVEKVMAFLEKFMISEKSHRINLPLIRSYINSQKDKGELIKWTVAICSREKNDKDNHLGEVDWGINTALKQISRTRTPIEESIGMLTSPSDETIGLTDAEIQRFEELKVEGKEKRVAAREARSPQKGLLLIYPISKYSKPKENSERRPLYDNPDDPRAKDLIALAISFPKSAQQQPIEQYVIGNVPWKSVK